MDAPSAELDPPDHVAIADSLGVLYRKFTRYLGFTPNSDEYKVMALASFVTTPPDYVRVSSGLGEAAPMNVIVLPVLFEGQVKAVIELASFERFNATQEDCPWRSL